MCVTPGGKIGNCTCGMPNCCHIRAKKAAFFAPPIRAKSLFSLPLPPYLLDGGSGVVKLVKQKRKARTGFNPKTQQKIKIPAKTVIKFRVAKAAKDAVLGVKK
jgi:hypothetical protein